MPRSVYQTLLASLLLVVLGAAAAHPAAAQPADASNPSGEDRPNIIFLFADDWGQYASAYASEEEPSVNDAFETPHVDRVAEEGILFENAFISSPSCTPSRAALTTGMHFYRTGRFSNLQAPDWPDDAPDIFEDLPGFVPLLDEAGYHTGHSGKTAQKIGSVAKSYDLGDRRNSPTSAMAQAEDPDAAMQAILDEIQSGFREYLADREGGQPMFFWFGANAPHRSWVPGSGKKFWGIDPADLEGKMPAFLPDVPVVREDFADYLGTVRAWDEMVGVFMSELARIGELDDTMVVLSGDHGIPGMPRGKTNLYDFGTEVPLVIRWPDHVEPGRTVTDFTIIPDLAPTFLEAAGVQPPRVMQARSLMPTLTAEGSGRIDPKRTYVVTGRERHVEWGRPRGLPYPSRAIRTQDYLYVRNFAPRRWPQGRPEGLDEMSTPAPPFQQLADTTWTVYADIDASPTKAWMLHHRNDPDVQPLFEMTFGKRPAEELYDLEEDPDQMNNVADSSGYADVKERLRTKLMNHLRATGDPRVVGEGGAFDYPPYSRPGLAAPTSSRSTAEGR